MATARKPAATTAPKTDQKSKFRVNFVRPSGTTARAAKTITAESYNKDGHWISFMNDGLAVFEAATFEVSTIERLAAAETVTA